MYAFLRGNIYTGFQAYGPWKTVKEMGIQMKEEDLPIDLITPEKAGIFQKYKSADEEYEPWIAVKGYLDSGFQFIGPLTEKDANKMASDYDGYILGIMPLITLEKC